MISYQSQGSNRLAGLRLPANVSNLADLLRWRAEHSPHHPLYTFLDQGSAQPEVLACARLDLRARAIAGSLQELGASGKCALIVCPQGREYVEAFFGCLYAGAVAVPAYPPRDNRNIDRLFAIAKDARPAVVLTTETILSPMQARLSQIPGLDKLPCRAINSIPDDCSQLCRDVQIDPDNLAFLQYTSGSTSRPRGVMVSHANLWHNEEMIQTAFGQSEDSIIVGWLPLFHDMGLIGNVLQPLYVGARCILFSPTMFLQKPISWLEAISAYRATTSGGPNFAYDLCVRKVRPEQLQSLDLSSWTVAFNGAEPVSGETMDRFSTTFECCGFRRSAFYPCYGLAEATLLVSGKRILRQSPVVGNFQRSALEEGRVVPVVSDIQDNRQLVSCGATWSGQDVRIVEPNFLSECPSGRIGEIWISGPSVAQGYWRETNLSSELFNAHFAGSHRGYLRTGDLGFCHDGELFITGRLKDLIIIRGRNHYPQDIEITVGKCSSLLRPGEGAAFSVEIEGEERLVVVYELVRDHRERDHSKVLDSVRQAIAQEHEVRLHSVVLLEPGTILKTSSGKIQRRAIREAFLAKELAVVLQWTSGESDEDARRSRTTLVTVNDIEEWLATAVATKGGLKRSAIELDQLPSSYGMDSLADVELAHQVESVYGVSLPPGTFLGTSSITAIADEIFKKLTPPLDGPHSMPRESRKRYALSAGQAALWFLHNLAPESAAYNLVGVARVLNLNVLALQKAFHAIVTRHLVLRSRFFSQDGLPFQVIDDDSAFSVPIHDVSGLDHGLLEQRIRQEIHRPFDLERGPVIRISLLSLNSTDYILLLVAHHIVMDFWSLGILARDLSAFYESAVSGMKAAVPALEWAFSDYVHLQTQELSGARGQELWDYWRTQLSGKLPLLDMPADHPRPVFQSFQGTSESVRLSTKATGRVYASSRYHGTTPFTFLLAAYATLLFRYTGQEDLIIGSPISGRTDRRFESLVGYFVNPVAIRVMLHAGTQFGDLVEQVRKTVLGALAHQKYPFAKLVDQLQPDRDPSFSPIFQTMFVLQKAPAFADAALAGFALGEKDVRIRLGSLNLESIKIEQQISQFDLTMSVADIAGRLVLSAQFNTDLFETSTIKALLGNFTVLIESITGNPEDTLGSLSLLTEPEQQQILEWNQTERTYPDGLVHQLFEAQANQNGTKIALECGQRQWTYRQLNDNSNQIAHYLKKFGAGPEVCVAICMERSLEMVATLLGILKAGSCYVPLDPLYPSSRLQFMLEDSRAQLLLTEPRFLEQFRNISATVIFAGERWQEIKGESTAPLENEVARENLAYVIYTSGSTGTPKGVAITHGSAEILVRWAREIFGPEELDGVLASTSICFDLSIFELFVPLCWGGKAIITSNVLEIQPLTGTGTIKLINTVPSAMSELLGMEGMPSSVITVNLAGEALQHDLVRRLYAKEHIRRVFNLYGPTEDTTYSTFALMSQEANSPVSIGGPIANTRVYVLDPEYAPAPVGVTGELCIGGQGLARGYLNRPDLTAERFRPDPFGGSGTRIYRTGDQARWRLDGTLNYIGRLDHQIKLRGYRIELGEIAASLLEQPGIEQAEVLVRRDRVGDDRLVAYVVGKELSRVHLQNQLRQRLPEYMVPSAIVILQQLPLTPNGKIDRKRLPQPEMVVQLNQNAAPRNPVEETLCEIWSTVLGVNTIGIHDNFFDLGGHSLLATQVVSRIRSAFSVELMLRVLFELPTIAKLAERVARERRQDTKMEVAPPTCVPHDVPLPLSYPQQRLWLEQQLDPASAAYNMPVALRLNGDLNRESLQASLQEIVRRHEVLRTRFVWHKDQPCQKILHDYNFEIEQLDLSTLPEHEALQEARDHARREATTPFDLAGGPLLRVKLIQLCETDHVLLLTMHHIVSDGWSIGVLNREFTALYKAFCLRQPSPLDDLGIQYADFAVWQKQTQQGARIAEQLVYWSKQLHGIIPLDLPVDQPHKAPLSHAGALASWKLPVELSARIKQLVRQERLTVFMVLAAALQWLLSRYTRQQTIAIGTPVSGRNFLETEQLIGCFVNTLVLRTEINSDLSVRDLLQRVRETTLDAFIHQDVPFEKLVEQLQPDRDLIRPPLFQVMFALQNEQPVNTLLHDVAVSVLPAPVHFEKFEITLTALDAGDCISGHLSYRVELFQQWTILRLLTHFENLLSEICADPTRALSQVTMLSERERRQIVETWNSTRLCPPQKCIHETFELQAERTPNAIAVVDQGQRLTYIQLNRRSNQLARQLRQLGIGPEARVGLCLERSSQIIVAILAVLKAGGAYVPLDPSYPRERLLYIADDAEIDVVVSQSKLQDILGEGKPRKTILLDSERTAGDEEEVANLDNLTNIENAAYLIYTSGSTGRPKGTLIPHSNVVRLIEATDHLFHFSERDCWTLFHSYAFDFSVWEMWGALLKGGRLVVVPYWTSRSPEDFYRLLEQEQITVLNQTPSAFYQLMNAEQNLGSSGRNLFLRTVILGGEALVFENLRPWIQKHGDSNPTMVNMYGITETTVHVTFRPVTASEIATGGRSLIGERICDLNLYILDEYFQLVPAGVAGELFVGGAGLARGYWNRPDLTAERFVPDFLGTESGGRLYRTGDLARWTADSDIQYLGRIDQQVKIRGYRIELEEIQSTLEQHESVRQAVVVLREDEAGERKLAAYVVKRPAIRVLDAVAIRNYLRERLPDYMVPAMFMELESVPLTANGKVDRSALPKPAVTRVDIQSTAPQTLEQQLLCGMWEHLLTIDQPGIHDNFFDLGGHSLVATQLVSRIRDVFKTDLSLRTIFESPTIAELSSRIQEETRFGLSAEQIPLERVDRAAELPLSFSQLRLWVLEQISPSSAYNVPALLRLKGTLNLPALEYTLTEVIRRHEILRTFFLSVNGKPVQKISAPTPIQLAPVDLTGFDHMHQEAEVMQTVAMECQRTFDLNRPPLVRFMLFRLAQEQHVIFCNMHHIVSDGWSISVLVREISVLYEAFLQGRPSPLPELTIQYADYAVWQRRRLQGKFLESEIEHWTKQLADAPPVLQFVAEARPAVQTFNGARERIQLPQAIVQALNVLSREAGSTLFMTLLAAFKTLLYRYSGRTDIIVGTNVAGRSTSASEVLIGFFVNMLVLRTQLSPQSGFREFLATVREMSLKAFSHQELPFEMLVEQLQPERNLSYPPLFQVVFSLQNAPASELTLTGLTITPEEPESRTAKYDLLLDLRESRQGLSGVLEYNTDLLDPTTVSQIGRHYNNLLQSIVDDPDGQMADLSLLSDSERSHILFEWNHSHHEYPQSICVHQLFEQTVAGVPGRTAIVERDQTLSYDELNYRANQIARYLGALGIGPGTFAGLCFEHSSEEIIALLGVLKTGAAYVPLDPEYPQSRVTAMLQNAGVSVLLTVRRFAAFLEKTGVPLVCLDDDWPEIARHSGSAVVSAIVPEATAYVIYTSGSTGHPKGVAISHRSLMNYVCWARDVYRLDENLNFPLYSSLAFDLTVTSIYTTLVAGNQLVIYRQQGEDLVLEQILDDDRIGILKLTPTHLSLIKDRDNTRSKIRRLIVGGEALNSKLCREITQSFGRPIEIFNEYGPTEATVGCMIHQFDPGTDERPFVPIGRPAWNTEIYILDDWLNPVPGKTIGELYISGDGLALGYLEMPELTAERFLPNPYRTGERMYKTGDLGAWLAQDVVEFLGRADEQVKIHGFRIELGEVEATLKANGQISDAVVMLREDVRGDKRLVAYVVPAAGVSLQITDLRRHTQARLPAFMTPASFVILNSLPMSSNGKVDRRRLPCPDGERPSSEVDYAEPQTATEQAVAGIWREVLRLDRVGINDNFFELGGQSILAIQIIQRVNATFAINLPMRTIFEESSIAALALRVEETLILRMETASRPDLDPQPQCIDPIR